jgi:hypothetical protein
MNKKTLLIAFGFCLLAVVAKSQALQGLRNRLPTTVPSQNRSSNSDSLVQPEKRKPVHITIHYRYLNDVTDREIDSSINDFTHYLPMPADYVYLGNLGTPAHSLIYSPKTYTGFDPGFHAFDIYRFKTDSTRFFQTTKPYTRLRYLIGSKQEQLIEVLHTQNHTENFNFGFHFRKINAPGFFRNQNTDDNSFNVFAHFTSKSQRYNAYLSFVANKLHAGENGGIKSNDDLENPNYADRRTIPVYLGGSNPYSIGFFTTPIATKSEFIENSWLFNQRFDWGTGDTIQVNDTTKRYEFHPVFRVEHTFKLSHQIAGFTDTIPESASTYYFNHYGIDSLWKNKLRAIQDWKIISNDLSLVQFPNKNNQGHFLKLGATYKYMKGEFLQNSIGFYDLKGHAEYHNLTRNHKWELDARGEFLLLGNNFGDYQASASLSRYLNEKLGDIKLSFLNLNQTPSFVYRFFQSDRFASVNKDLKKTNITRLQLSADNDHLQYRLDVNYFLLTNFTYFKSFYASAQEATAFNLLQIILHKKFTAGHFNWYLDLALQQTTGSNPLHVPLFWTRNRFTYENTLFKNLILCTGLEGSYHTPYNADYYSPVLQQFISQNEQTLSDAIPHATAFIHFRIKAFVAYVRAENLNVFVTQNLKEVPHYPYPDFAVRVGLQWAFVN